MNTTTTKKHGLILFSGTKSFSKVLEKYGWECRSVDMDNHFKPFYNVDILKWDYKEDLKDWKVDYIHSSPVCKNFTPLKNSQRKNNPKEEDINFSISLVSKTLEIINYVKTINPNLKFTIENPRGYMRKIDIIQPYEYKTTSYCKYGFNYQKPTDFWYGGFDLKLKKFCSCKKGNRCEISLNNKGIHPVRIGYSGSYNKDGKKIIYENQMMDCKYFKQLKKDKPEYKGYTDTYLRYRIPPSLIKDIVKCL